MTEENSNNAQFMHLAKACCRFGLGAGGLLRHGTRGAAAVALTRAHRDGVIVCARV